MPIVYASTPSDRFLARKTGLNVFCCFDKQVILSCLDLWSLTVGELRLGRNNLPMLVGKSSLQCVSMALDNHFRNHHNAIL